MRIATTEILTCNNCGGRESEQIAVTPDFEYRTVDNEFHFSRCTGCGLVYLRDRPAIESLSIIYPRDYIPHRFNEHLGPVVSRIRNLVQSRKVRSLRPYAGDGALIVDVGCGNGEFLQLLRHHGNRTWRLVGVDFADEAVAGLEALGIPAVCGRFETLDWPLDPPHLIVMNQVLEHLDDPAAAVAKAFNLLTPGGAIFIETPSVDAWDARLFRRRYWGGWHTPRHWVLYSPITLEQRLEASGFEVVETTHLLSPNFWLQSFSHCVVERWSAQAFARYLDVKFLPALVAASFLDVVQKSLTGKTSNFRMVGRKPGFAK